MDVQLSIDFLNGERGMLMEFSADQMWFLPIYIATFVTHILFIYAQNENEEGVDAASSAPRFVFKLTLYIHTLSCLLYGLPLPTLIIILSLFSLHETREDSAGLLQTRAMSSKELASVSFSDEY